MRRNGVITASASRTAENTRFQIINPAAKGHRWGMRDSLIRRKSERLTGLRRAQDIAVQADLYG